MILVIIEIVAAIIKLKYCDPIKKNDIGMISKKKALKRIKNFLLTTFYLKEPL
jgi:hypothetical protein